MTSRSDTQLDECRKLMRLFTNAIDAALWIGLEWNDHNHSTDTILFHAQRAADSLGLVRGGPDRRDELFSRWNSAIENVGAGGTAQTSSLNNSFADWLEAELKDYMYGSGTEPLDEFMAWRARELRGKHE